MQCSRCRHQNEAGAKFCGECGGRLESVCPACSAVNPPTNKFCQECGTSLGKGDPSQGSAPAGDPRFTSPDAYTPTHLARKILTARSSLAGERKKVTVLFADLKGSLELLADRDPEDARALLDAVLERMMEAVHRYEGTVNQVMGDGIMALFGAPVAHEDHAVRACYAALRMQRSVSRYADELRRRQGIDVQIRAGINSGDVVVRSIGSDLNVDYSAVGQTTHLAARMEQLARPGTVMITDATRRLADRYIEVEGHGPVPVKGLKQPVEVFELKGAAPASRAQTATGGLTRFLGREDELRRLERVLEMAAGGQGQVVGVAGEAGVGKSRLVWEFTRSTRAQAWLLMEAPAVAYAKATPYAPITAMLTSYFQVESTDDAPKIRAKVSAKVLELDPGMHWAIAPILSLGNIVADDPEYEALEPAERRRRIFGAVTRIVRRESERQPVLVVVENAHWADTETAALVDTLVEEVRDARVLLVASYRSEYRPAWREQPHCTEIRLSPLSTRSAEALIEEFLGPTPELQPLTRMLVERTGGNALFVEESVRSLIENEVLVGDRGAYRLAKPISSIQIPDRVQSVLAARIDRLPDERKSFLQAGAVIGKDLPFSLLQAVAGVPADQLLGNLAELEEAQFLQTTSLYPDLAYSFRHALTHDVVYSTLLKEQRRNLHARIVDALEALYPDRRHEHVERLAHHALGAELWFEAVSYLREAAAKALARSANREAVAFLEQALAALGHVPETNDTFVQAIDVRLDMRPPLLQLGRLDEIRRLSGDALRMAEQIGDEARQARAYAYLINYHYLLGEPARALEYGERCLTIAERLGDRVLVSVARRYMGHAYHAQGQARHAIRSLQDNAEAMASDVAREPTTAAVIAYVSTCAWLAFTLADLGEFEEAETWADRARAEAEARRHPYSEAIALTLSGQVSTLRGQLERAVAPLSRALQICRDSNLTVWQAIPAALLGQCLVTLDRKEDGLSLLEEGVRLSDELGVKAYLARWATLLGEGFLAMGDLARAGEIGERALGLARAHGERGHEAAALRLLADVAAAEDDHLSAAAERYAAAIAIAEELGLRPLLARSHLGLGQALRRGGRVQEAEEHLATAVVHFSELGMWSWLDRSEPDLRALGHLVIVARPQVNLYEYLRQKFADDPNVQVVLDRRYDGSAAPLTADRRHLPTDQALRTRGLAVIISR
ncbi:MAG TPA: adenylate/guanylate cyclase domain-containing protein [Candidatus Binatia bacterium]|nr:adenylate/guanylate cyclase domain-containing protein [Candidatus Binatia bacterium]